MSMIDDAIAIRLLYLLVTPFDKTDAFKFGIIDKDGKPLRRISSLKTSAERDSYSYLHRFIFRLKKLLAYVPGGKTTLGSYAAAFMLVKEHSETLNDQNLEELYFGMLNAIEEDSIQPSDELYSLIEKCLNEEGEIANTTNNINISTPRVYNKKRGKKVRFFKPSKTEFDLLKRTKPLVNEDIIILFNDELICS